MEQLSYILAASAACGLLIKFIDELADVRVNLKGAEIFSIGAGTILGWLAARAELFPLYFGMAAGLLFSKKIDHMLHYLGFAAFLASSISFIYAGPPLQPAPASFALFFLFAAASYSDEQKLSRVPEFLRFMAENRLFLGIAALAASIATANYAIFLSMLLFDVAYKATAKALGGVQFSSSKSGEKSRGEAHGAY